MSDRALAHVEARFNATRHGATSSRQIVPRAARQKRRLLRQIGLRARDIDPVARGYLDLYCRAVAKVELLDDYFDEHGLLKADGEPQPATKFYVAVGNTARLALARLEDHLRAQGAAPSMVATLQGEARRIT